MTRFSMNRRGGVVLGAFVGVFAVIVLMSVAAVLAVFVKWVVETFGSEASFAFALCAVVVFVATIGAVLGYAVIQLREDQ